MPSLNAGALPSQTVADPHHPHWPPGGLVHGGLRVGVGVVPAGIDVVSVRGVGGIVAGKPGREEVLPPRREDQVHLRVHWEGGLHPSSQAPLGTGDVEVLVAPHEMEVRRESGLAHASEEVHPAPQGIEPVHAQIQGVALLLRGTGGGIVDEDPPGIRGTARLHEGVGWRSALAWAEVMA